MNMNKSIFPTASGLKYAMACPGSTRLMRVGSANKSADDGNARHEYLAAMLHGDSDEQAAIYSELSKELQDEVREFTLDNVPPFRWVKTEVAFAWDSRTQKARVVGENIGRDYAKHGVDLEHELAGTADFVGVTIQNRLVVGDWKTGNAYTVEATAENWQLKFLSVCVIQTQKELMSDAAQYMDVDAYITRTKGGSRSDIATFNAFDLDAFAFDLNGLAAYIKSDAPLRLVEGSHCQWCPSFDVCPAKTALVRAMAGAPKTFAADIGEVTAANVQEAYARYRIAKVALRKVESKLQGFAARSPIQLSGGKVYGPVVKVDEHIDPVVAKRVLEELIGPAASKAFDYSVTKTGIKAAIGTAVEKGKGAATYREAMYRISAAGGVVEKDRTELREHTPGEESQGVT